MKQCCIILWPNKMGQITPEAQIVVLLKKCAEKSAFITQIVKQDKGCQTFNKTCMSRIA